MCVFAECGVGVERSPGVQEGEAHPDSHLGASLPGGKTSWESPVTLMGVVSKAARPRAIPKLQQQEAEGPEREAGVCIEARAAGRHHVSEPQAMPAQGALEVIQKRWSLAEIIKSREILHTSMNLSSTILWIHKCMDLSPTEHESCIRTLRLRERNQRTYW